MSKIWIIARKDIKEAFRSRSTYIYIALLFFLTFTYFNTYGALTENITSQADLHRISSEFINNIVSALPMMYGILICTIFAAYAVILEKARHNLESLMVTPVSLNKIWIGKALAITLPSVLISLGITLLGCIVMNIVLIMPKTGDFVIPGAVPIVTALIIVPVMIFLVVMLVIYLQLVISNPRIANFVFTAIFLALFFGINILTQMGLNPDFYLIFLGIIVVCGIACRLLSLSFTREKVVLSSRT